jgi:hypothetical protein
VTNGEEPEPRSIRSTWISDSAGERIRIANEELEEASGYVDIACLLLTGLKRGEVNAETRDALVIPIGRILDRIARITEVLEDLEEGVK